MKDKSKKNIRSTNWLTKNMTQEEIRKIKEDAIREADIELMAREIAERDCYLYDKCPKKPKHNCVSQDSEIMLESSKNYVTIATWLVNANYQKVDKDSVVLTKAEKQKLLHEMYEQGRFDALADIEKEGKVVLTKENYEKLCHLAYFGYDDAYKKGSKETVERFAKAIFDKFSYDKLTHEPDEDIEIHLTASELFELAKQFGVDIKEN